MSAPRPGPDYSHRVIKAWQAYGTALENAIATQRVSMQIQSRTRGREWLGYVADELARAADGARQVLDSQLTQAMGDLLESQNRRGA